MTDSPVLDTLAEMTAVSIDRFSAPPDALVLIRIAALVAVDAPPVSYLANLGPAAEIGVTLEDVQNVLVAVAPIVGTARVMAASANIAKALGFAIAVADDDE